jgi:hypothetical protein
MQYPNILAFVEGDMERLFINQNFHYVEVIPISNGCSWTVERLCEQIETKFRARNKNADVIAVWVDRERRDETSADIRQRIIDMFAGIGVNTDTVRVGIPDFCTENWLLSDVGLIEEELGIEDYRYTAEGASGYHRLKELFRIVLKRKYRKTVDGPKMLKALTRSSLESESARVFFDSFTEPCWWLER